MEGEFEMIFRWIADIAKVEVSLKLRAGVANQSSPRCQIIADCQYQDKV